MHGEDLIWRLRDRARAVGLDQRELRARGALEPVAVGDTVTLRVSKGGSGVCLFVGQGEWCGLGFAPEETLRYLMNLEGASPSVLTILDVGWMAVLFFPLGLLALSVRNLMLSCVLAAAVVVVAAAATPLVPAGPPGWVGLVLGVGLGAVARPLVRLLLELPAPETRPTVPLRRPQDHAAQF